MNREQSATAFTITTKPIRITFPSGEWIELALREWGNDDHDPSWELSYCDPVNVHDVSYAVEAARASNNPRDMVEALQKVAARLLRHVDWMRPRS